MFRKNVSGQHISFQGVDATTGGIKSGVTWTVRRCIDGTFAAAGATVTEDGTAGWYTAALTQADTNGNNISFNFTGTGAVPQTVNIVTTAADPTDAVHFGLSALPNAAAGASGGLLISGSNAGTTTLAALTVTGTVTVSDGISVSRSTSNSDAISATGSGSGSGLVLTGGAAVTTTAAGHGVKLAGGAASTGAGGTAGNAIKLTGGAGAASTNGAADALLAAGGGTTTVSGGSGFNLQGSGNISALLATGAGTGHGALLTGGNGATGNGLNIVANSTNGNGVQITGTGTGDGLALNGGTTGRGIHASGGGTSGAGARFEAIGGNSIGLELVGHGGNGGLEATGGATGPGGRFIGGGTSGDGLIAQATTSGNGFTLTAVGTSTHGFVSTGGTGGTSDGIKGVAGTGGVDIRGNLTGNITGTLATVTTLTNLPSIPANWLTATGINAGALNGKGDWLLASSYTTPPTTAQIATGVWQDQTAGDFTVASSIGKSVMNGVSLGTGLTVASVSGSVGSVTGAVGSVTGNVGGNVVGSVASVTGAVGSVTGNVGGNVTGSVGSVAAGGIASTSFAAGAINAAAIADAAIDRATFAVDTGLQTIRSNTAQTGSTSTTIKLDASASATDNVYSNDRVYVTGGTGVGQVRAIRSYVGSTKVATIAPAWTTTPDNTSTFAILPWDSVWDEVTADHLASGTAGNSLNSAGSAGDPWTTALPGAYGAGTAGFIVGTNLDALVSSRLASASYTTPPTTAQIATGVWQDTTAGDFTTALSVGKSIMNGVALGTGLTVNALTTNNDKTGYSLTQSFPSNFAALGISAGGHISTVDTLTTYTGNTPQTGDSYARIGAAGVGLTNLGDARLAHLDADVSSRLSTSGYTAPDNTSITFLKNVTEGDRYIDTTTTPWNEVIEVKGTTSELVRKKLRDVTGANITATTVVIGSAKDT